jgi:hypothetical protein
VFLDLLDGDDDIGFDSDSAKVDAQLRGDGSCTGSGGLGSRLEDREGVLAQRITDLLVGMIDIVITANRPALWLSRDPANCFILRS